VAACVSGVWCAYWVLCSVHCTLCFRCVVCVLSAVQRAAHAAQHSVHTPHIWNTCCHNTAKLITMYFYWLILQNCDFSQALGKLPEDGPDGPKHVGANVGYFNVNFNILCLIKGAFVGKEEFWRNKNRWYVHKNVSNSSVLQQQISRLQHKPIKETL